MKAIVASQTSLTPVSVTDQSPFWKLLPFIAIYMVYGIGLFIDVMDVDAAQYASIAREMLETGNYLHLYNRYQDYLDKPPLLFWMSALFFKLFGVSNFAYKLPAFIFSLIGTYATYRLAKLFYGREIGYIAALMLASCQAFFLFNHDVRTDTNLTGAVILAIWQLAEFNRSSKLTNLILGFTGVALAMLAKGPIGLMVPVLAFTTDFILKRQWLSFFRWQWLLGLAWVGLLLLPMCIGLYQQFDMHPEKVMYGRTGTSGLKFFFWTQSFGRLTGENVWKNNADIFLFMHTFLWSFLPWSLLFIAGFYNDTLSLFKKKFRLSNHEEALTWGGFIFPYIALSTSKYQLPHYIFVLFPLAAIIAAKYVYNLLARKEAAKAYLVWKNIQLFAILVIWAAIALLILVSFPLTHIFVWLIIAAFFAGSLYMYVKGNNRYQQLIIPSVLAITGANFALNAHVYPELFKYQSPGVVARYVLEKGIDLDNFYYYKTHMHSLDFYTQRIVPSLEETESLANFSPESTYWIYTNADGLSILEALQVHPEIVETFDHFHISTLTLPFLNPYTRHKAIEKRFLLKVEK